MVPISFTDRLNPTAQVNPYYWTARPLSTKRLHFPFLLRIRRPARILTLAAKKDDTEVGGVGSDGGDGKENRRSMWEGVRWQDLVLSPDPDNVVAVGLTGLLTWASVQVLWQLLFISSAILVAALKYSFIAALLIFILITLL